MAWLAASLDYRRQRVVVGNAKSPWLPVVSSTTRGTVLGFLLFHVFSNDLPSDYSPEDKSLVMLLADDTKTFQDMSADAGQQLADRDKLQTRLLKRENEKEGLKTGHISNSRRDVALFFSPRVIQKHT